MLFLGPEFGITCSHTSGCFKQPLSCTQHDLWSIRHHCLSLLQWERKGGAGWTRISSYWGHEDIPFGGALMWHAGASLPSSQQELSTPSASVCSACLLVLKAVQLNEVRVMGGESWARVPICSFPIPSEPAIRTVVASLAA
eukprot:1162046-Pelagomonas_calceolata.AAC.2